MKMALHYVLRLSFPIMLLYQNLHLAKNLPGYDTPYKTAGTSPFLTLKKTSDF